MKKLLLLLILIYGLSFGQEFKLTEDNFKAKEDIAKNYIVLSFPGLNKENLFEKIKKYISSNYPYLDKEKIKESKNDQILFELISNTSRTIYINKKGSNVWKVVCYF